MSRRFKIAGRQCAVFACCLLLAAAAAQAQTKLRWKFQQGQVLNQVVQQDMKMTMELGGQVIDTTMNQTIDAVWKIGQVDDQGAAEIEQKFTRMRMKMQAAGGFGFEFDSSKDEELTGIGALIAPALNALAKSKFTLKMTALGEIEDVKVSEETVTALQSLPGAGQMGGMFSKDGLIQMVKQGAQAFPEKAVSKGDSWSKKAELALPQVGKMVSDSKFTYAGPEVVDGKSLERVDVVVTTTIADKEDGAPAAITVKDQKGSGSVYFDNAAGRVDRSTLVQNMTMAVSLGGNKVDQKIVQTITVRVTPAENQARDEEE